MWLLTKSSILIWTCLHLRPVEDIFNIYCLYLPWFCFSFGSIKYCQKSISFLVIFSISSQDIANIIQSSPPGPDLLTETSCKLNLALLSCRGPPTPQNKPLARRTPLQPENVHRERLGGFSEGEVKSKTGQRCNQDGLMGVTRSHGGFCE